MAPQRAFSAPTTKAVSASSVCRVPSRWDGRIGGHVLSRQCASVALPATKGMKHKVLSSTVLCLPVVSSVRFKTPRSVSVKPASSSPGLCLAPAASTAPLQWHNNVSLYKSMGVLPQEDKCKVLLPKFEPPPFTFPLPVPESPDAEAPFQEPKSFGEWPCATNSFVNGPGDDVSHELKGWLGLENLCSSAGVSQEVAVWETWSPSPDISLESAMQTCLSSCWSYHSSKVVNPDAFRPFIQLGPELEAVSSELLLQTPHIQIAEGAHENAQHALQEITLSCTKISDSSDEAEHETSSEVGYEDRSSSNYSNSPSSSENNVVPDESRAVMLAKQEETQEFMSAVLVSPWTPAWSTLEASAPTSVLYEGISSEESALQPKHFRWYAPSSESPERYAGIEGLPKLDLHCLPGDLQFQENLKSPCCSSTCSYSSSEEGCSDRCNQTFVATSLPKWYTLYGSIHDGFGEQSKRSQLFVA